MAFVSFEFSLDWLFNHHHPPSITNHKVEGCFWKPQGDCFLLLVREMGTVQSGGGIVAVVPGMIFNGLGIPWKVPTGDSLGPFFSNFNGRVQRVIAICLK